METNKRANQALPRCVAYAQEPLRKEQERPQEQKILETPQFKKQQNDIAALSYCLSLMAEYTFVLTLWNVFLRPV